MVKLPCPQCGTLTESRFCANCSRERYPLVERIKPIRMRLCAQCDRIHMDGSWRSLQIEDAVERALGHSIVPAQSAVLKDVAFTLPDIMRKPGVQREETILVIIKGNREGEFEERHEVPYSYEVTLCQSCRKRDPAYHQGILQVRNETQQSRELLSRLLEAHPDVHLTKRVEQESGTDYYLSDNRSIGAFARKLHAEFGGEIKVNAQHFSEDKQAGKILYRTNALIVLPQFRKNDVVERDGSYYLILGISDKIKAEDLLTKSVSTFPYERDAINRLKPIEAQVVSEHPFEVLHPQTFQAVAVENAYHAPPVEPGEKVWIVLAGNHVFVLPILRNTSA